MANSKGYVTRLVTVECSYGTTFNYLNVETDHGVIWYGLDEEGNVSEERPLMNANDHKGDVNILCFGRCKSPSNKVFGGDRDFHIGSLMDALGSAIGACEGYKCTPYCSRSWAQVVNNVLLDGAPAITSDSNVTCYYGGEIKVKIQTEEESGENQ